MVINLVKRLLFGKPVIIDLGYHGGCKPINKWLSDNVGEYRGHKFHNDNIYNGIKHTHQTFYGKGWQCHVKYEYNTPEGSGVRQVVELDDPKWELLFRLWVQ